MLHYRHAHWRQLLLSPTSELQTLIERFAFKAKHDLSNVGLALTSIAESASKKRNLAMS